MGEDNLEEETNKDQKWYNSSFFSKVASGLFIIAVAVAYSICNETKASNSCIDNHFKGNAAERSSLDYLVIK